MTPDVYQGPAAPPCAGARVGLDEVKASGNISYGDCFAAALAKLKKADLVTGDNEFNTLEGEIKLSWI